MVKTQLSTNYLKHTSKNPIKRFLVHNFNESLLKIIKLFEADSILDVGCGEGFTLKVLKTNNIGGKLEGIDISKEAIVLANKNLPNINFKLGNVYKLPYKDSFFNLVISTEVLEHLEHPEKALRELIRVSNKYLLLSVPNEPWYRLSRLLSGINILKLGDHKEHVNHWGNDSFAKFVVNQNLNIKKIMLPFPWIIILAEKN